MNQERFPKWFHLYWKFRKVWIGLFVLLGIAATLSLPHLQFNFSFEQFFPEEDEDLTFFREFVEDFESDDNFLLLAFEREPHIFESGFLEKVDGISRSIRDMPHVKEVRSLTHLQWPQKTPFGPVPLPVLDWEDSTRLAAQQKQLPNDPRFSGRLISEDGTAIIVFVKTKDELSLDEARELRAELDPLLVENAPEPYHYLGRAYFMTELVDMQKWEVGKSSLFAGLLIAIVMFFLFRRKVGIIISLSSIALTLGLFFGFLVWTGSSLTVMAALYPIIMIIVGTSDVIHIMSKYIDEGRKGNSRKAAMYHTIREIGLATFLTSVTTAVGFGSLAYSRISSIQEFGFNAAMGVLIAYICVIFFTTSLLSYYSHQPLQKDGRLTKWWPQQLRKIYQLTLHHRKKIYWGLAIALIASLWGISMISTNYNLSENLPEGYKVTSDFQYFEKVFGGYRPYEYAIEIKEAEGANLLDYEQMKAIHELESYLKAQPEVQRVNGPAEMFQWINMYYGENEFSAFAFPDSRATYQQYLQDIERFQMTRRSTRFLSDDLQKARVSSTIKDVGADSVKRVQERIAQWYQPMAEAAGLDFKATGTGVIFDKNSEYVRESLLYGLGMAIGIVSLLMALLFRSFWMLLIAFIPNFIPLLMAAALLGFTGTELEAGIAIIFAVVFGIAVDDTIHFLSKYKLARQKGEATEQALLTTFLETGKALVLTSIILFAGFLILLFSVHPPTRSVGWLISITLLSALIADFLLIPLLIRAVRKKVN